MLDSPETERAKRDTDREIKFLPSVKIEGETIEPHILIHVHKGRLSVIINKAKLYRTLSMKNQIQMALDLHLVDSIQKLLDTAAERENIAEADLKNGGNQNEFQKSGTTGTDNTDSGQGGTETDNGGQFV